MQFSLTFWFKIYTLIKHVTYKVINCKLLNYVPNIFLICVWQRYFWLWKTTLIIIFYAFNFHVIQFHLLFPSLFTLISSSLFRPYFFLFISSIIYVIQLLRQSISSFRHILRHSICIYMHCMRTVAIIYSSNNISSLFSSP